MCTIWPKYLQRFTISGSQSVTEKTEILISYYNEIRVTNPDLTLDNVISY